MSRGEFSIIMANLAKAGTHLEIIQPFAALYVLILAVLGPLLTKESKQVFKQLNRVIPLNKGTSQTNTTISDSMNGKM